MVKDFKVAWKDRDWEFHSEDVLDVDSELAVLLVKRGIATKVNLSEVS